MRLFVLCGVALLVLVGAASPSAAADEIGLSRDGVTWHERLTEPMFDPRRTWVPGDTRVVEFLVRNQARTEAEMTVTVKAADRDELLDDDHIELRARSGGPWVTLRNGEPSGQLTPTSVGRGGIVRVELQAQFTADSSNASQRSELAPRVDVTLEEAVPRQGGDNDDGDEGRDDESSSALHAGTPMDAPRPGSVLPLTGTDTPRMLMWLGGAAVTAGALLLRAAHRRRGEPDDA